MQSADDCLLSHETAVSVDSLVIKKLYVEIRRESVLADHFAYNKACPGIAGSGLWPADLVGFGGLQSGVLLSYPPTIASAPSNGVPFHWRIGCCAGGCAISRNFLGRCDGRDRQRLHMYEVELRGIWREGGNGALGALGKCFHLLHPSAANQTRKGSYEVMMMKVHGWNAGGLFLDGPQRLGSV